LPSSVRPIGAQLSARAAAPLGNGFVYAQAGDKIRRITSKDFSSFSRAGVIAYPVERDQLKEVHQSWPASTGKTSVRLANI
jgi:hypothetical protein